MGLGRTDQVSASYYQYISTTTELLCNKYTLQVGKYILQLGQIRFAMSIYC